MRHVFTQLTKNRYGPTRLGDADCPLTVILP